MALVSTLDLMVEGCVMGPVVGLRGSLACSLVPAAGERDGVEEGSEVEGWRSCMVAPSLDFEGLLKIGATLV